MDWDESCRVALNVHQTDVLLCAAHGKPMFCRVNRPLLNCNSFGAAYELLCSKQIERQPWYNNYRLSSSTIAWMFPRELLKSHQILPMNSSLNFPKHRPTYNYSISLVSWDAHSSPTSKNHQHASKMLLLRVADLSRHATDVVLGKDLKGCASSYVAKDCRDVCISKPSFETVYFLTARGAKNVDSEKHLKS